MKQHSDKTRYYVAKAMLESDIISLNNSDPDYVDGFQHEDETLVVNLDGCE
jgi:hypothetical protein